MALLSFRGISTPSLPAQGGQRRFSYFNIQRGNPDADGSIDKATDTLGLPRLNRELVLFVWREGTWERMKSWPIPAALAAPDR